MFNAIMLRKSKDGSTTASVEKVDPTAFDSNNIEIDVSYSTLNYKDALAITGKAPIVRSWPMIPGIDLAGTVRHSMNPGIPEGTKVIVNGHGMGEQHWGGLAQRASVPAEWITRLPEALSERDAMGIGTAGYTAMLSVLALEHHGVKPDDGPVLVTGANGGVGSFAIALLAGRGYHVTASTGRLEHTERLKSLGAKDVIDRNTLSEKGRPLQKERWAAAIDCVGSHTLANICAQVHYGGVVTACGLAQGLDFPATVAPFILRGITLVGIDSVYASQSARERAWTCLANETTEKLRTNIASLLPLGDAIQGAHDLLAGRIQGRVIIDVTA